MPAAPPGPPPLPPLTPEEAAETNIPMIMGVTGTFHILALIFFGVRMYTRFILVKAPKLDDAVLILSTIGAFASGMVMFILQAGLGLGRHRQTISDEDYLKFRLYGWVYSVACAVTSFSLLKISIVLSLMRMSKARWYTWSLYGLIGFIVSYTIVALCSFFFHCRPMQGSYNATIESVCYSRELFIAFSIMNTSFNMFSDVMCATLPIPIIWTLNMKLRTRLYLIGVMSLGYLTVGLGVVKAYWQVGARRNPDSQFTQDVQFWGFLQFNLGIIVACAPTLRPLLGRALKLSSRDKYSNNYYGNRSGGTGAMMSRKSKKTTTRTGPYGEEDFEMDDNVMFDKSGQTMTTVHGGKAPVYDKSSERSRSGSEELILQENEPKGILRTTQIHVQ